MNSRLTLQFIASLYLLPCRKNTDELQANYQIEKLFFQTEAYFTDPILQTPLN